jgi:3alpha(or 20beta)-hydroxysteroid dehydrogenase
MGASHARGCAAEGANLIVAAHGQGGRELADELGDRAISTRLDVTSEADWAATVAAAEDAFGPVSNMVRKDHPSGRHHLVLAGMAA